MIDERNPELLIAEIDVIATRILEKSSDVAGELQRSVSISNPRVDNLLREISVIVREATRFLLNVPRLPLPEGLSPTDRSLTNLAMHINSLQRQLNRWGQVEALTRLQNPVEAMPLYRRQAEAHTLEFNQTQASDKLNDRLHSLISSPSQSEAAEQHGCYADIPLRNSEFFQHVQAARRVFLASCNSPHSRFLDVGCGVGVKVLAASDYFNEAVGLEYDANYLTVAESVVSRTEQGSACVMLGDGLTFEGYAAFDVVYFYKPMRDEELLQQLEAVIAERVRPGTILIAPYREFLNRHKRLNAGHVDGGIYVAQSDQEHADVLREKAERIGNAPLFSEEFSGAVWAPILNLSRGRGFSLPNL